MEATVRQRTLRALTLMVVGVGAASLVTLRPQDVWRDVPFLLMTGVMLAWTVAENLVLRQDEPKSYRHKAQTRLMQAAVVVAVVLGMIERYHLPAVVPRTAALTAAGVLLVGVGGVVRIVAIRTLGRNFSYELRVRDDHRLVDVGIYRVLRHPSYLGLVLVATGAPLALASPFGAIAGGALLAGLSVWRIRDEEAVLRSSFGEAYDDYAGRTWRLVPFVY